MLRFTTIGTALVLVALIWPLIPEPRVAHAAQFEVTTTADTLTCAPGNCSLRGAIIAANAAAGPDVILLPEGTYTLTIPGADGGIAADNDAKKGDLDIITGSNITIVGDGPDKTIIDGNGDVTLDRVFDINQGAILQIGGATVSNGKAGIGFIGHAHGAGIHNHGSLIMQNVVVRDNRVVIDNWGGGGITNAGSPVVASSSLNNVTIFNNEALTNTGGGGGIENLGNLQIQNSTIAENRARTGGGIDNRGANALAGLTNVTISGNRVEISGANTGLGGGLLNSQSKTLAMTQVTLAFNDAEGAGGNFAALAIPAASVSMAKNTIFANGVAGGIPQDCVIQANAFKSEGFNLATDDTCGLTNLYDRPGREANLGALKDNGGLTPTHRLKPGSEAIDGCNPIAGEFEPTDQRGVMRPRDGDGDGDARCDIGAYEAPTAEDDDNDNGNDND